MPFEEARTRAPEAELIDEAQESAAADPIDELEYEPEDAPEAEPFDEIDDPTTLETVAATRPLQALRRRSRTSRGTESGSRIATPAAPPKPAAVAQPRGGSVTGRFPRKPRRSPRQPSRSASAPVEKPVETAAANESLAWYVSEPAAEDGAIDGSFFSGMGLSSGKGRAGASRRSVAAGATSGLGPNPATTVKTMAFSNAKNAKSVSTKTKSKKSGRPQNRPRASKLKTEGKAAVKKAPQRGPQMWQIMVGVGGAVVLLIIAIAAFSGNDSPTVTTLARPAVAKDPPRQFGPHTVTGPINDRTTRSPVTGAPVKVPFERHGDLMLMDVRINDQDAGKFLLDTGTADLIISKDVADKLHLPLPQGAPHSKNMKMPGGVQTVTERKVDSVTMGNVRFEEGMIEPQPTNEEWLAIAVDIKPWSDAIGVPIVGVIGGEVWSQVPFSIDPASNVVTFFKKGPMPLSTGSKPEFLTRFDNFRKPALSAKLDNGPEGTFVVATGVPSELMVKGSAAPVKTLDISGLAISDPATVESKNGDGYYDPNEIRQSGVIGAGILSHYLLIFDYEHEKFLAVPLKK